MAGRRTGLTQFRGAVPAWASQSSRKSRPRNAFQNQRFSVKDLSTQRRQTRRPGPDLVFRTSSRFVGGHDLVGTEERRERNFFALGELGRNGFQILLVETHGADFDGAVRVDQEDRGYVGQAVSVGHRVAILVEDQREGHGVFPGKILGRAGIVLRDAEKRRAVVSVLFVEALEKRKRELADGAGDFEESGDDGPAFQESVERVFLVVERFQRKSGSFVSGNDVRHLSLIPPSAPRVQFRGKRKSRRKIPLA